ncbi:MAG: HNH endonuclease signature motif containing protein [Candidatus Paceibacterota bacterium]
MKLCLFCKIQLNKKPQVKYCSNKCQADYKYKIYIEKWLKGLVSGDRGINAKNISCHVKKYLMNKYDSQCSACGWGLIHPITKISPLEIDHIDGDSENNKESNLRLLCPNCHSLTDNFRNLNKGKGRRWRREIYNLNKK